VSGFYADRQAAAPVRPEVLKAMLPYFSESFGNPQSLHSTGQKAARALQIAREQIARLINCQPDEIIFRFRPGRKPTTWQLKV